MTTLPQDGPINALRVHQWHEAWNGLDFDPQQRQARPKEEFYLFSLPASRLRALSGIYRRDVDQLLPRAEDLGIQRRHDPDRSAEIARYVVGGYPWSTLSERKRMDPANDKLRKPGWLPTAVVVNILEAGDQRDGRTARPGEVISIESGTQPIFQLTTPISFDLPPIEVIDGQHRLFAFDEDDDEDYELPVVAFHGLDISWQAYLFWTINIKPKKINPSLAFDLYPLLREQDWLESGEVIAVYKESRAQELTEALWSTPSSPWYRRVNMLGGSRKENGPVTQAAFIRSLVAAMVKSWRSPRSPIGGIFGGTPNASDGLAWSRLQQAAFLVTSWRLLADAVGTSQSTWAAALRDESDPALFLADPAPIDPAFGGQYSLLATDQGVRGFLHVLNDMCFVAHSQLEMRSWQDELGFAEMSSDNIERVRDSLQSQPVFAFVQALTVRLAEFDWRSSGFPQLGPEEAREKAALRGSGGYKELRRQLVEFVNQSSDPILIEASSHLLGPASAR